MIFRTKFSVILAIFVAVAACDNTTEPQSQLESARARWASHAPAAYSYTVTRSCFCPTEVIGPVTVTVRNDIVESRRYTTTGASVSDTYAQYFPTVAGLFAHVDSARGNRVAALDVTYDASYGFPTRIAVADVDANATDDEYSLSAKDFQAR